MQPNQTYGIFAEDGTRLEVTLRDSWGFQIGADGTVTIHENGVERIAEGDEAARLRGAFGGLLPAFEDTPWWWMSFTDPERPQGTQFLGVAIVQADDEAGAVTEAWERKVNPGGQIALVQIPPEHVPAERFRNRLLTRAEAEEAGEK